MPPSPDKPVLLFDGVCNLCNGWVNFVIDRDPHARILFAPLQSTAAKSLLRQNNRNPDDMDTVVFIDRGSVYERSDAVLQMVKYLRGAARILWIGWLMPRRMRNALYDLIAKKRYQWFGKRKRCRIPEPELVSRFLEMSE